MILAILAAISVPSYRQYVRKNAQSQAESSMQALGIELERWRAKALSYGGFVPSKGWSSGNTIVYIPYGSTAANYNYAIEISSPNVAGLSVPLATASPANRWVMVARPRTDSVVENMPSLGYSSQEVRCLSTDSTIYVKVATVHNCGEGSKSWQIE